MGRDIVFRNLTTYLSSDGYWPLKTERLRHPCSEWNLNPRDHFCDGPTPYRTFTAQFVRFGYSFIYNLFIDAGSSSDYKGGMKN